MAQHVRYKVTHAAGDCPVLSLEELQKLLDRLPKLAQTIRELSDGKAELVYQEYDRNAHEFNFGIAITDLRVEQGGDFLKEALGLTKVTISSQTFETFEQAGEALTAKLKKLQPKA